jgi:hypothetical protein
MIYQFKLIDCQSGIPHDLSTKFTVNDHVNAGRSWKPVRHTAPYVEPDWMIMHSAMYSTSQAVRLFETKRFWALYSNIVQIKLVL